MGIKSIENLIKEALTKQVDQVYPNRESLENILKSNRKLIVYWGIDPTSPDVHLGHSTNLFVLRRFQNLGHKIIILIGDYTAKIGDPTGMDKSRKVLADKEVRRNYQTYKQQILKILDSKKTTFRLNSEWWDKISAKQLLELDRLFTHQQIIERDMFERRIEKKLPISFTELQYPILQGYDSVALNADIEVGATEQLFNMLTGRYLAKTLLKKEKFVVTTPILENPKTGKKLMSKSEGNYISIQDNPNQIYGKVMALPDTMILTCFKLCTDLNERNLKNIDSRLKSGENPRNLKTELAYEIVKIYHGEKKAKEAREEFERVFGKHELPKKIPLSAVKNGHYNLADLLVKIGLAPSKNQARRLVMEGAVKINDNILKDPKTEINAATGMIIRVGKKHFRKIK